MNKYIYIYTVYIYCTRWKDLQEIKNNGLLKSNGKSHMFESRHGSSNELTYTWTNSRAVLTGKWHHSVCICLRRSQWVVKGKGVNTQLLEALDVSKPLSKRFAWQVAIEKLQTNVKIHKTLCKMLYKYTIRGTPFLDCWWPDVVCSTPLLALLVKRSKSAIVAGFITVVFGHLHQQWPCHITSNSYPQNMENISPFHMRGPAIQVHQPQLASTLIRPKKVWTRQNRQTRCGWNSNCLDVRRFTYACCLYECMLG